MINLTPHAIVIRRADGDWTLPPSGSLARVTMAEYDAPAIDGVPVVTRQAGHVTGLVRDAAGLPVPCLVSAMVLAALPTGTPNVYAPDSGPTAIRNAAGQVVAVTRLVAA